MNKPSNILNELTHKNGVVEIWVLSKPRAGRMHSAGYPTLWGYLFNGIKYSSKKKAYEAVNLTNAI